MLIAEGTGEGIAREAKEALSGISKRVRLQRWGQKEIWRKTRTEKDKRVKKIAKASRQKNRKK